MSPVARQWAPLIGCRGWPSPARRWRALPDNVNRPAGRLRAWASEQGVPVDVTHSTATVFIHEKVEGVRADAAIRGRTTASGHRVERRRRDMDTPPERCGERPSPRRSTAGTSRSGSESAPPANHDTVADGDAAQGSVRGGWFSTPTGSLVVGPPGTELVNEPSETIDVRGPAAVPDAGRSAST